MKIQNIYDKYKIMPNLQEHMLRVAGVASIICDTIEISIDKTIIISACLLHDMGGMVKVKFDLFPEQFEAKGIEYWKNVQHKFINNYGSEEHDALHKIAVELKVYEKCLQLIKGFGFRNIPIIHKNKNIQMKICEYADMRVSPKGVVLLMERLNEAKSRYLNKQKGIYRKEIFETNIPLMVDIEKQIFTHCKIKPEDITEEKVRPLISELRNFEIDTKV